MANVKVVDNGAAFLVTVDGLVTSAHNSLGGAWRHIEWMYAVASQRFTVGDSKTPVKEWINGMHKAGYLDGPNWAADIA
jgi:hypothetical protein